MNSIWFGKKLYLLFFVLLSASSIFAMEQKKQVCEQKKIDKDALRKIKNSKPAEYIYLDAYSSFELQMEAMNHNVRVPLYQKKKSLKK